MYHKIFLSDYGPLILQTVSHIKPYTTKKSLIRLGVSPKNAKMVLSFLIQKRFAQVHISTVQDTNTRSDISRAYNTQPSNQVVYYSLVPKNIERRLYFPMYVYLIDGKYGKAYGSVFLKVLIDGFCRISVFGDRKMIMNLVDLRYLKVIERMSLSRKDLKIKQERDKNRQHEEIATKTRLEDFKIRDGTNIENKETKEQNDTFKTIKKSKSSNDHQNLDLKIINNNYENEYISSNLYLNNLDVNVKKSKIEEKTMFLIVDYDFMDSELFNSYFLDYLEASYDISIRVVFEAITKCIKITKEEISGKLPESIPQSPATSILCTPFSNHLSRIPQSKEQIIETALAILKSENIIKDGIQINQYRVCHDQIKYSLKQHVKNRIIDSIFEEGARRVLNLIYHRKYVEDKDILKYALFDSKRARRLLVLLYENGLIQLSHLQKENKTVLVWEADFKKNCFLIAGILEKQIVDKIKLIDSTDAFTRMGGLGEEMVHLSDKINLSKDYFILKY